MVKSTGIFYSRSVVEQHPRSAPFGLLNTIRRRDPSLSHRPPEATSSRVRRLSVARASVANASAVAPRGPPEGQALRGGRITPGSPSRFPRWFQDLTVLDPLVRNFFRCAYIFVTVLCYAVREPRRAGGRDGGGADAALYTWRTDLLNSQREEVSDS